MTKIKDTQDEPSVIVAFEANDTGQKKFLGAVQPTHAQRKVPEGVAVIPLGAVRTAEAFGWMAQLEGKLTRRNAELAELTTNRLYTPTDVGISVITEVPPSKMFSAFMPKLTFEAMPKDEAIALEHKNRGGGPT